MQGISVYARAGRSCWYVAYDCPDKLRRVEVSSRVPLDDPKGKVKAYEFARARSKSGIAHGAGASKDPTRWEAWAESWLNDRYKNQPATLTSYMGAWKFLRVYLYQEKCYTPAQLNYGHVLGFVHWREEQVKKQSGRKVSRNTALHNIKVLSRLMSEAVRRGYAQGNPCYRTDIAPAPVPEKPEFTAEDIERVRAEFKRRAGLGRPSDWMAIAFEIALYQGCRLSACQIPLADIDLHHGTILLREKGSRGEKTVFTLPIHPELRPLLARLKAERGREFTCVIPKVVGSRNFGRVMKSLGLSHTFHSTRVTVISAMARGDVPEQKAMAYVHHGNWAVHKIYQRLKPPDVAGVHAALNFSSAPTPAAPRKKGARRASG